MSLKLSILKPTNKGSTASKPTDDAVADSVRKYLGLPSNAEVAAGFRYRKMSNENVRQE